MDDQGRRCTAYRRWVFDGLESILTRIDRHKRGILRMWALTLMCKAIDREMCKVKKAFTMKTAEVTPDFVEGWSFFGLQGVAEENAPTLCELLRVGVQTTHARNKGQRDRMVVSPVLPYASLPNAARRGRVSRMTFEIPEPPADWALSDGDQLRN